MTMRYENPFPGMDPYLEQGHIWPGFHNHLISAMALDLSQRMTGNYRVDIQERAEVVTRHGSPSAASFIVPDALVLDTSVLQERPAEYSGASAAAVAAPANGLAVRVAVPEEVRVTWLYVQRMPEAEVITIVEVLSPSNKAPGEGRENYLRKRSEILTAGVSLVEIDLLRQWEPMPLETDYPFSDYRVLVCRGWQRFSGILYPFNVPQAIPSFKLPLRPGDDEPEVDLGALINRIHRQARYTQVARYSAPLPGPSLPPAVREWVDARLELWRSRPEAAACPVSSND